MLEILFDICILGVVLIIPLAIINAKYEAFFDN